MKKILLLACIVASAINSCCIASDGATITDSGMWRNLGSWWQRKQPVDESCSVLTDPKTVAACLAAAAVAGGSWLLYNKYQQQQADKQKMPTPENEVAPEDATSDEQTTSADKDKNQEPADPSHETAYESQDNALVAKQSTPEDELKTTQHLDEELLIAAPQVPKNQNHYEQIYEQIKTLLEQGANPNATSKAGLTPLMRNAAVATDDRIINLLIQHGADVNAQDNNGKTALIYAAQHALAPLMRTGFDRDPVVHALTSAGAHIAHTDNQGLSAIDYAKDAAFGNPLARQRVRYLRQEAVRQGMQGINHE